MITTPALAAAAARAIAAHAALPGLALLAGLALAPAPAGAQGPEPGAAGTVVLVHGAWGGGWDWRPVDRMLTARGYDVYRVTLTGLGERVHLVGPDVDLSTHVADVVNTILFEQLSDVVLLGHSYGGMVITGVADSIPERLEALVYLDAFLPHSGESVRDIFPALGQEPDGDVIVPSWVDPATPYPRDVPHPAATLSEPLELNGPPGAGVRAAYFLTVEPDVQPDGFQWAADRAADLGWPVYEIEADHNAQRSAREELVRLIESVAQARRGTDASQPLTADGWGPLRIGMTRDQVVVAAGEDANPGAVGGPEPEVCDQFRPSEAPAGMLVMIERGRLTRISLSGGSGVTTDRGFGVGDPASAIIDAYGPAAETSPHKYLADPGQYITVWTKDRGGPDARGIRYEIGTDARVAHVHVGGPSIEYVEGCL